MKKTVTLIFILFMVSVSNSQINGITETGDEVLLLKNGTWKYKNDSLNVKEFETLTNNKLFIKDKNSNFLSKSEILKVGVWIDPKEWSFAKSNSNNATELEFQKKNGDIYAMLITEKLEAPLESLANIAFENAKEAAPDVEIVKKEYRTVNGLKVIMMQLKGTIQGIKFMYYGYYYASENGAVQLVSYTSQNFFDENKIEMENLINGLVKL